MARSSRKNNSRREKPEHPTPERPEAPAPGTSRSFFSAASLRETAESLIVALIAAFLIRSFVMATFVIPTGSMAPTLMGRHKDLVCPKCSFNYQVNASLEMDEQEQPTGRQVIAGTCPMCRFTADLSPDNTLKKTYPSYSGDRIIAVKPDYQSADPKRWDVIVFHYPLNAGMDYIKRLVGLPGETVKIQYGDLWLKPKGADQFTIARKPPEKLLATMQAVYDNDYVLPELIQKGLPPRWTALKAGGWTASADQKSFHCDGKAPGENWLVYRHVVPRYEDWQYLTGVSAQRPAAPKAQLISDFTPYDTEEGWPIGGPGAFGPLPPRSLPEGLGQPPSPPALGLNWVGDLIAEFDLNVQGDRGQVLIDLVKGGHSFLCRLDLEKATVSLTLPAATPIEAHATTGIRGSGKHTVRMAHVDQQLLVWLDGRLVPFDAPTTYDASKIDVAAPNQEDLMPVRIGSDHVAVEVSHLRIWRDIYYIAVQAHREDEWLGALVDFDPAAADFPYADLSSQRLEQFFSNPAEWAVFRHRRSVQFDLAQDQFFMLGDNSAQSKDGRLWGDAEHFVNRNLLVGHAVLVYWPHSWNRIPGTPVPFPYFPNFSRMGRIQ